MKNFMFKKVEVWIVGLIVIFFIILIILISGILRDTYLNRDKTSRLTRDIAIFISEIPKNIYHLKKSLTSEINKPPKLSKHKDKKKIELFSTIKRDAIMVLPRYDHNLSRSVVDIIDLNNFQVIHSYKHNVEEMIDKVKNKKEFPRIKVDLAQIRFEYRHPLILNDGSLISEGGYAPLFKIDICSNLEWINDEIKFHHSKMLDHEENIWVIGALKPYSKHVLNYKKFQKDFYDDAIIKINPEGKILYKKSIIEMLIENKKGNVENYLDINLHDPIHLNDVEPVFLDSKYWKKGDLFLSIRNLSSIVHYRPSTNEILNYIIGPFAQQHDIDIVSDNEISIFNNNNFLIDGKYSEVLIYNFEDKKFKKIFDNQLKKENFKTKTQGLSHLLKDQSLMVEEQNHGRIILFNKDGEKEWEYINKDINQDIGFVSWARIIEDKMFVEKYKSLIKNKKCIK